jgi:hypothetical protein
MQSSLFRRSILFIGSTALMALGASSASAQLPEVLTFRTVFPFVVGNREVPAGSYVMRRVGDDQFLYVIQGPKSAILETNFAGRPPEGNTDKAEVIFKRYGDTLVMQEVWDPSSGTGLTSAMKFEGAAETGHVAQDVPATVVVPATMGAVN